MFTALMAIRLTYGEFSQVSWTPAVFCAVCALFHTAAEFYYLHHMYPRSRRPWRVQLGAWVLYGAVCALIAFLYARAGDMYSPNGTLWDEVLLVTGMVLSFAARLALGLGVYGEELWDSFWITVRLSLIMFWSSSAAFGIFMLHGGITSPPGSSHADFMAIADGVCALGLAAMLLIQLTVVTFFTSLTRTRPDRLTLRDWLPLAAGQLFGISTLGWLLTMAYLTLSGTLAFAVTGILYMNAALAVYVQLLKTRQGEKDELARRQYAVQAAYYDRLYQEQENTRALWHDMSKYLDVMGAAAAAGDGATAAQVMADARTAFGGLGRVVDVGSRPLSAVLQLNVEKAEQADIPVRLNAWVPERMGIALSDLGILLGNTFDNAIAACQTLPKEARYMDVTLTAKNDILFYEIKNPYTPDTAAKKEDKYHGYGLPNARRAAEKYGGGLTVRQENGVFTVTAYLSFGAA